MSDIGRALVTEREKEILAGEADVSDNYRYKVESTVRNRIKQKLGDDVEFLQEHFEEGYELAVGEICEDGGDDA
jgi:hypothetical protein